MKPAAPSDAPGDLAAALTQRDPEPDAARTAAEAEDAAAAKRRIGEALSFYIRECDWTKESGDEAEKVAFEELAQAVFEGRVRVLARKRSGGGNGTPCAPKDLEAAEITARAR